MSDFAKNVRSEFALNGLPVTLSLTPPDQLKQLFPEMLRMLLSSIRKENRNSGRKNNHGTGKARFRQSSGRSNSRDYINARARVVLRKFHRVRLLCMRTQEELAMKAMAESGLISIRPLR